MNTPALDKLLSDNQEIELADLYYENRLGAAVELDSLKELLAECASVIAPFVETYQNGKPNFPILIDLHAAAKLAEKLKKMNG